jgi:hypothetical protein
MSIAADLAKGIAHVARDHYKEKKRQERSRGTSYRAWREPAPRLKVDVFASMPEAIARVSSNGTLPFTVRQLFYQIRPLVQDAARELTYAYFTPPLVTEYEDWKNCPILGLMYDARGHLVAPHGLHPPIPLGTAAVQSYEIPDWGYKAILYIEKEGFAPIFEATRLKERYDIALMMGKGYGVRAAKALLAAAEERGITLLVLHDCDVDGYEIARTLAEETRTSEFELDIIDIGLKVADVTAMGLETERVSMRRTPPWEFRSRLTPEEEDFFLHKHLRTELNAMTSLQLVEYIERKLEEHGLGEKLVPPEEVVAGEFEAASQEPRRHDAQTLVRHIVNETYGIDLDDLEAKALDLLRADQESGAFYKAMVEDLNNGDREMFWQVYITEKAIQHVHDWTKKNAAPVTAKISSMLPPAANREVAP